jgi:hypothetical protein
VRVFPEDRHGNATPPPLPLILAEAISEEVAGAPAEQFTPELHEALHLEFADPADDAVDANTVSLLGIREISSGHDDLIT